MKKLKESRGDFSINGALLCILVMVLLILAISVLGVASRSNKVHAMAAELVRYIEIRGQTDSSVDAELARLERASGIDVASSVSGDYISGTQKIQFGGNITVTLTADVRFGVGGLLSVPIRLHSTATGRSEKYWK